MLSRWRRATDRPWLIWILLLACGQAADLATTRVDLSFGALEGNATVANLMHAGGLPLVSAVKLLMVLAMAVIVAMVLRHTASDDGKAVLVRKVVWRGLQFCVFVLMATDVHNVLVLAAIQGWPAPGLLTAIT